MWAEPEYVLIGTGLAPLLVARHLESDGHSVIVLNPDSDFFLEDSEWPLEPIRMDDVAQKDAQSFKSDDPTQVHSLLQSEYPGAMELWLKPEEEGFHDLAAPHIRARSRLLMWESGKEAQDHLAQRLDWQKKMEASGVRLRECDGLTALRRFPGSSQKSRADLVEGLLFSGSFDVDVARYRNNILEFVRERLGNEKIFTSVSGFELDGRQVRFRRGSEQVQAKEVKNVFMFWTPRLAVWSLPWLRHVPGINLPELPAHRYWEKWSLESRDQVFHDCIANFDDLTVWGELEGAPSASGSSTVSVLRSEVVSGAPRWASEKSFQILSRLFHDLLGWDKFSIHSMRSGTWFDWESFEKKKEMNPGGVYQSAQLSGGVTLNWVGKSEGPLHRIVMNAKKLSEVILTS